MFLKEDGFKIQVQRRKERHENKREVRFLQILPARFVTDFVCGMAKGGPEDDPQVLFQYFYTEALECNTPEAGVDNPCFS